MPQEKQNPGKQEKPCYHANQNNNRGAGSIMDNAGSLTFIRNKENILMWAKDLPVCRKDQQEMRRTATQFSDNHHQTSHGGRRTDIATVETKKVSEGTLICISICPQN